MTLDNLLDLANLPVPDMFLRSLDSSLKLYNITNHKINGADILKELIIDANGDWQFKVRGMCVSKHIIGLQHSNCIKHLQTVLSLVEKCDVCIGKPANRSDNNATVLVNGECRVFGANCGLVLPLSTRSQVCRYETRSNVHNDTKCFLCLPKCTWVSS
jgi:hypothetical protein